MIDSDSQVLELQHFEREYIAPQARERALDLEPDGFFPGAPTQIVEKLPESQRRTVLTESAGQFYNLL